MGAVTGMYNGLAVIGGLAESDGSIMGAVTGIYNGLEWLEGLQKVIEHYGSGHWYLHWVGSGWWVYRK